MFLADKYFWFSNPSLFEKYRIRKTNPWVNDSRVRMYKHSTCINLYMYYAPVYKRGNKLITRYNKTNSHRPTIFKSLCNSHFMWTISKKLENALLLINVYGWNESHNFNPVIHHLFLYFRVYFFNFANLNKVELANIIHWYNTIVD